jgi:hypothetical protein
MYLDVYIGWLAEDGSLCGSKDPSDEIILKRESPFFPDGHQAFSLLKRKIEESEFTGEQIDWGRWAAAVTKQQIILFMGEFYGEDRKLRVGLADHQNQELQELEKFVDALPDDKVVALVACEL